MNVGQRSERHFADAGVQVDPGSLDPVREEAQSGHHRWLLPSLGEVQSRHSRWLLPSLGVLFMCVCIQTSTTGVWEGFAFRYAMKYFRKSEPRLYPGEKNGVSGVTIFDVHDLNNDGFLSPEEFEPLAQRLTPFNDTIRYDRNISAEEEVVTLDVRFLPLKLETLTKDLTVMTEGLNSLTGLKQWTTPAKQWQNFGAHDFQPFLPTAEAELWSVGQVYWIFESSKERGPSLSSERYLPPLLDTEGEKLVHRLLALFHPLPFVHTRFAPKGSTAVIRAYNEDYVDIVFRIHAEFQLNRPPFYPFWFTPAQFKGHLTISRDGSHIIDFHLYVPDDKRLNVDMEWLTGSQESGNMEVDIGYMPQMELLSTTESHPAVLDGVDHRDGYIPSRPNESKTDVIWKEEISVAEAERLLEVEMYPFKKVTYYNFTDGMREATRVGRPIHSILLWGCLDDQSC